VSITVPSTEAGPSRADRLRNLPQYLLPQRLSTRVVHWATRVRATWFKNALIRAFCAGFKVDMSEAEQPDPIAYEHFNAFFTRALKPDARPLAANGLCCPIDGSVSQVGTIADGRVFQAKGRDYSLTELLGGDQALAAPFRDGGFATLYLAPRDYHRIHMPCRGRLTHMIHVPGRLFSVSPLTTRVIPRLFARNERVVCRFETDTGPLALVLVGAINVASIETVWAGVITPPLGRRIRRQEYPAGGDGAIMLERGAELGRFNMGSTVIVLTGPTAPDWNPAIQPGATVRMGQRLGRMPPLNLED
jgi:phosphatidylserine decarboxylase